MDDPDSNAFQHHRKNKYRNHCRASNHRNYSQNGSGNHDTESLFEQARQAQLLGKSSSQSSSNQFNGNDQISERNYGENEGIIEKRGNFRDNKGKEIIEIDRTGNSQDNWKGILGSAPSGSSIRAFNEGRNGMYVKSNSLRKLVRNGCISPNNIVRRGNNGWEMKGKGKLGESSGTHVEPGIIRTIREDLPNSTVITISESEISREHKKHNRNRNRNRNQFTGKRKHDPFPPKPGGCSSSARSFTMGEASNLGSNMEIDALNTQIKEEDLNVNSNSRASQIESDEMLARKLQEQFYREAQGFEGLQEDDVYDYDNDYENDYDEYDHDDDDDDDDDDSIAWALQDVDNEFDTSTWNSLSSSHRNRLMEHLSSRNPSSQIRNNPRSQMQNFNNPQMDFEMTIMSQLSRVRSSQMDLDTRLNILEALEEMYENSNNFFPDPFVFDEDQYEVLSALDEENERHTGASDAQINSLPLSMIKGENSEDPCPICLEPPSVGAVMRHLPCLHKFHKDCIDTWLRKRTSCPVCKSGIT